MRDIVINCRKVYDTGTIFHNKADEIDAIEQRLKTISKEIENIWSGDDSHNFIESFNAHVYDLENMKNYLNGYCDVMRSNALDHSGSNNRYASELERSDYLE